MQPAPPLLAIDIGNSRIKFGLFHDWCRPIQGQLPIPTEVIAIPVQSLEFPWDRIQSMLDGMAPLGAGASTIVALRSAKVRPFAKRKDKDATLTTAPILSLIASVNPPVLDNLLQNWPRTTWPEPRLLRDNSELPIANATQHPAHVGTDRLLKAVAGNVLRATDQPMILVDCGTATTVDWVTSAGAFAGGAILPGVRLLAQALHDHTALLPLIAPEEFASAKPAPVGTDTAAALKSGIYWGHVGAVRELIQRMSAEHPDESPQVLITGGAGEMIARDLKLTSGYHPHLTLQGLVVTARALQNTW